MINKNDLLLLSKHREILIREESFAYLLPCIQLRNLISNFTITFPDITTISDVYTILPHGSVTLVFFYYHQKIHSFLFGPTTQTVKVGDLANQCDIIFIIEFQPAGFMAFTNLNQNELVDKILPFSSIDYSFNMRLMAIFQTAATADELLLNFENELISNIKYEYPKELIQAIQEIIDARGIITVSDIADHASYCVRQLNRTFNQYLGMSMKAFSRLVRINNSFHLLNEQSNTLNTISDKLGYYDTSHYVKDFKIVCGITPQKYRDNMSDFYSEIAKF